MHCFTLFYQQPISIPNLQKSAFHSKFAFKSSSFGLVSSPFPSFSCSLAKIVPGYGRPFPVTLCSTQPSSSSSVEDDSDVELDRLLALLPEEMKKKVCDHPELCQLIEVIMDLGRKPLARFPSGDFVLSDCPITVQDIDYATSQVKLMLAHHLFDELFF